MKVMNPGNIDAQPTADADHHLWEEYVRAKLPIVHLILRNKRGDGQFRGRVTLWSDAFCHSVIRSRDSPSRTPVWLHHIAAG